MEVRILVIDDDRISREIVGNSLKKYQFNADMVDTVPQAMHMAGLEHYAIIITDKNMPDTTGHNDGGMEILKYAKMNLPGTEVIMMTAYGSIESAIEAMKHGAFDYITKPLDPLELKTKIERIIAYQSFINPKNAILIYRTLHNAILNLMGNKENLPSEELHESLKKIDENIDHFFRAQKEWERVLLIQKEALGKIAIYAEQLQEMISLDPPQSALLESICSEAAKRI